LGVIRLTIKIMIDYKKLGRLFDSADQQKLDRLINVNTDPLISQYDEQFIKHGFVEVKDNKYNLKMREDTRSVFQITKSIALNEINWLVGVISKILNDETDLKEIDRLRDQLTIQQLQNDKVSEGHKRLVGDLYKKIDDLSDIPKKLRKKGLM
jgi:vacuolar-type H+-ATPase subunit I/STV1